VHIRREADVQTYKRGLLRAVGPSSLPAPLVAAGMEISLFPSLALTSRIAGTPKPQLGKRPRQNIWELLRSRAAATSRLDTLVAAHRHEAAAVEPGYPKRRPEAELGESPSFRPPQGCLVKVVGQDCGMTT
jgi:hypothetical protein